MKKILLVTLVAFIAMPAVLLAQSKKPTHAHAHHTNAQIHTPDNTLSLKEKKAGWKLLFDGKDLKGWHSYHRDTVAANWIVKDGQIQYDRTHDKSGDDLVTDGIYENYELQLQWRISQGGNSGIIFDIQENDPKHTATYVTGPEMQVLDNKDADDNKKQNHLAGCLYDMIGDSTVSKPVPVGQWNQVKLVQNKGHLTFWLNGIKTVDVTIGSPEWNEVLATSKFKSVKNFPDFAKIAAGRIAVQKHPGSSGWKNIKIREIKD